eukprot:TRINITY_DN67592_c6_g1_i4.p1 TRINITY_DN67592_c6_g1~~TRINITY_DN67592_c6_g1_i4.p1  ORF type:complete len:347 (+),score=30.07 TRINITY_DN67592_c6_g1_i4:71-1111(+)
MFFSLLLPILLLLSCCIDVTCITVISYGSHDTMMEHQRDASGIHLTQEATKPTPDHAYLQSNTLRLSASLPPRPMTFLKHTPDLAEGAVGVVTNCGSHSTTLLTVDHLLYDSNYLRDTFYLTQLQLAITCLLLVLSAITAYLDPKKLHCSMFALVLILWLFAFYICFQTAYMKYRLPQSIRVHLPKNKLRHCTVTHRDYKLDIAELECSFRCEQQQSSMIAAVRDSNWVTKKEELNVTVVGEVHTQNMAVLLPAVVGEGSDEEKMQLLATVVNQGPLVWTGPVVISNEYISTTAPSLPGLSGSACQIVGSDPTEFQGILSGFVDGVTLCGRIDTFYKRKGGREEEE